MVSLLPHPIPHVLGQGDDGGKLLEQERVEPLLPFDPAYHILTRERDQRSGYHSGQSGPCRHDPSLRHSGLRRQARAAVASDAGSDTEVVQKQVRNDAINWLFMI